MRTADRQDQSVTVDTIPAKNVLGDAWTYRLRTIFTNEAVSAALVAYSKSPESRAATKRVGAALGKKPLAVSGGDVLAGWLAAHLGMAIKENAEPEIRARWRRRLARFDTHLSAARALFPRAQDVIAAIEAIEQAPTLKYIRQSVDPKKTTGRPPAPWRAQARGWLDDLGVKRPDDITAVIDAIDRAARDAIADLPGHR
jgi:hypothetical protein